MRPTWGGIVDWGGEAHSPTQAIRVMAACILDDHGPMDIE
jgi:hypothetical protein